MLIRSWNLFHGNSSPPRREAFLDEMVALVIADDPDVVLLQEVPAFALGRFTAGGQAARPMLGPLPISASVGARITSLHHGLLRSAFSGQGNAIEVAPRFEILDRRTLTLNPPRFRAAKARELSLGLLARLAWAKERRIAQAVRLRATAGRTFTVCNVHCTSIPDRRIPDAELLRAAWFASSTAEPGDVVVLGGDFNVTPDDSPVLRSLATSEWGFSPPGPGIDHILVRGAETTGVRVWPAREREDDGVLLSDHAPVEVRLS